MASVEDGRRFQERLVTAAKIATPLGGLLSAAGIFTTVYNIAAMNSENVAQNGTSGALGLGLAAVGVYISQDAAKSGYNAVNELAQLQVAQNQQELTDRQED